MIPFCSIVFSAVITVIVAIILGWITTFTPIPKFKETTAIYELIIFVTTTAMFLIVGYMWALKEGEDYFTPLRKSLRGKWLLTYQEWAYDDSGKIKEDSRNEIATFGIDRFTKKLFVIITITNHPIFGNGTQRVDGVAISAKAGSMKEIYYPGFTGWNGVRPAPRANFDCKIKLLRWIK